MSKIVEYPVTGQFSILSFVLISKTPTKSSHFAICAAEVPNSAGLFKYILKVKHNHMVFFRKTPFLPADCSIQCPQPKEGQKTMKMLKFRDMREIEPRILNKYGHLFEKSAENQYRYAEVIVNHG